MGLLAGRPFETEMRGRRLADPPPDGAGGGAAAPDGRHHRGAQRSGAPRRRLSRRCACAAARSTGSSYQLEVASAQLKSALVLAALQARGPSELREPARSRDHTERMLGFLGAPIAVAAGGAIVVDPSGWNGRLKPRG